MVITKLLALLNQDSSSVLCQVGLPPTAYADALVVISPMFYLVSQFVGVAFDVPPAGAQYGC